MLRNLLVLFAIFGLSISSDVDYHKGLNASVVIVKDINFFKISNPDLQLKELIRSSNKQTRAGIRYTLGSRVAGDRLVATLSDFVSYATPQNVKLTLTYPTSGTGAIVTHVLVDVQQSSNVGKGYLARGGIGQRFIQIVIEAKSTTYFGYSSYIYGV